MDHIINYQDAALKVSEQLRIHIKKIEELKTRWDNAKTDKEREDIINERNSILKDIESLKTNKIVQK